MESTTNFDQLGKRARNAATKRVALLDALLSRLEVRPLPAITVRELCLEVGIAEQTFFNTFSGKPGALVFYVMLWSVEMQWRMARASSAHAALRLLFARSAEVMRRTPWLMPEIIVHQIRAKAGGLPVEAPPTVGDKLLRFPDLDGVAAIDPAPIGVLVGGAVARAIGADELPAGTDAGLVTRLLCALFFGAGASTPDPDAAADLLNDGFTTLWRGFARDEETRR